ncbi:uncharacterized protein N7498_003275 [Penicillium cinerascens]|uniref:Uncharacterized protein n=1 Tax=Penicillium cinerascens TaxID=70096 RepID=A0A9W9N2P0_9EURO|nr:uncharacterized protein N7498_003275 [Penicillium cinerascens]KAJ5211629.1 hypothetical protein N7498_003275 [Penicillium cinerascens]
MASDQSSLYGKRREKSSKTQGLPSSSTLSFTSQLSSLISQNSNSSTQGRQRPSKNPKSDIFGKQNKGAQKRAAADLQEDDHHVSKQVHQRSQDIGGIDDVTLGRSKRRMEEKVRQYEDMKKGLYLAGNSSDEDETPSGSNRPEDYLSRLRRKEKEGLVDFDRKWANEERKREEALENSQEEDDDDDDDNASMISYEDELGRSRRGTRAEAAQAVRAKEEEERGHSMQERWRPNRPENLIYGEAVQSEAFNPDANIASHMANLAARRDRSATPPDQRHYDADAEVRNRGTGFYAFSRDETERQKQMDELKRAREETQRQRDRLSARAAEHQATIDDRRRQVQELRSKRLAVRFLGGFPDTKATST